MKRYSVQTCREHRDWLIIFGDNLGSRNNTSIKPHGKGGQAIIRDEPNAVGIATKMSPTMEEVGFFNDGDYDRVLKHYNKVFSRLEKHLAKNGVIVWPEDGIGTGLAQLAERAPKIWTMLDRFKAQLFSYGVESWEETHGKS